MINNDKDFYVICSTCRKPLDVCQCNTFQSGNFRLYGIEDDRYKPNRFEDDYWDRELKYLMDEQ